MIDRSRMLAESLEAPARVREFLSRDQKVYAELGARLRALAPAFAATIARGSSDHAANYAAYLIPQCTGRAVASIPPSLVTVLKSPLRLAGQFVLAISQSGGSPDILRALEAARKSGALTAALVNDAASPLARAADVLLDQRAGKERSVAATKSALCTLAGIARLTAEWSEDAALGRGLRELPAALESAAARGLTLDPEILRGVSNVYVLSRGLGLSAALEVSLKLKETCGIHAEAFSAAEVLHGPREIVAAGFLVIAVATPGSGRDDVLAAAAEMKGQGARVLVVAPPGAGEGVAALPELSDPRLLPIAALQLLYPWIARSSKALGRDPDRPKTLKSKVIKTV
jgi:glucosamine--fructose-6-phosphate aminotransferase (isomerizing)